MGSDSMTAKARPRDASATAANLALGCAWAVALAATLGAVFVGEIMGQAPCDLCWYQRMAMFPLSMILGIAVYRDDDGIVAYALPLTAAGALVAGFHSLLYAGLIPEGIEPCGKGPSCLDAQMTILGGLPLPFVSLAAFAAILVLLLISRTKEHA